VALGQADHKLKQKLVREALAAISSSISSSKSLHSSSRACNHEQEYEITEERTSLDDRMPPRENWIRKADHIRTASSSSRSSPIVEISFLLSESVKHGLRTIAFCKTRKLSELVFTYTKEIIATTCPHRLDKISVYRAGYSPDERRAIESDIFNGKLLGVAATNALELGIDIGGLDCTLHLGFPGSIASLWQQAGRAGRRNQHSLAFYVGWDGPLDQYFMSYPENLFSRPIEEAHIDVHNPKILEAHLRCAAHEAPLVAGVDRPIFGKGLDKAVGILLRTGQVAPDVKLQGALRYAGKDSSPSRSFTLRDIDEEKFLILDESDDMRVVDNVESRKAFFVVYDGAILLKQGRNFICKSVDLEAKVAIVRPTDVKYYTTTIDYTDVHITGAHNAFLPHTMGTSSPSLQESIGSSAIVGDAVITTRWMGYVRIWRGSGQVFDKVDLFLPDQQYQTVAISLRLPSIVRQKIQEKQGSFRDGVHGAAHALMNVLPLMLLCNPEDVGTGEQLFLTLFCSFRSFSFV
jgi:DEAD/DEAH box helicase domain-containing protein